MPSKTRGEDGFAVLLSCRLFHPLIHAGFDPGVTKLDVAGSIPVSRSSNQELSATTIPAVSVNFHKQKDVIIFPLSRGPKVRGEPARLERLAGLDMEDVVTGRAVSSCSWGWAWRTRCRGSRARPGA